MDVSSLQVVLFTLLCAMLATALALPLGVAAGWWLTRRAVRSQVWLESLLMLPWVLSPTAIGLLLLLLLGRRGLGGRLFELLGLEVLFTWRAVVLAGVVMALPFVVRGTREALARVDARLLGIARTLGEPPLRAFMRVELPLARRGILVGMLWGLGRAAGEFGATLLVAGNIPGRTQTLALALFQRVELGQQVQALPLLVAGLVVALALVFGSTWLDRRPTAGRSPGT